MAKTKAAHVKCFSLLLLPSHTYSLLQTRSFHVVFHKPFQQGIFHGLQFSKINLLLCGLPVGHSSYRKCSSSPTYCFPVSQYFGLVLTADYDVMYLSFCISHSNKISPTNSLLSVSEHPVPFRTSLGRDTTATGEIPSLNQKYVCPVQCNKKSLLWDVTSFSESKC